ncbi:hypothetical protein BX600DRAFT_468959 [Xylariales sp. PMI_506]|nr:hypothetical protein BX600DRAFT_468959 [Xylariales sp. PMI_506]
MTDNSASADAANLKYDYEVKFLLDPKLVLGPDNKLDSNVATAFGAAGARTMTMNVEFFDTDNKQLYNAGWSPRIRRRDDKDDFQLTFKKRYPIQSGDIDAALTQANRDGFDASAKKWEAQVEWGYNGQTLSISCDKKASDKDYKKLELPDVKNARKMLNKEAPEKFKEFGAVAGWNSDPFEEARAYGPVLAERWEIEWGEYELDIEVWPIRDKAGTGIEYIVEASYKAPNTILASSLRRILEQLLKSNNWLVPKDSLKTQFVMERY